MKIDKEDRIYKFEHRIELWPNESIVVWRWNVAGDFGYPSSTHYKRCGYHLEHRLHNLRRPLPFRK